MPDKTQGSSKEWEEWGLCCTLFDILIEPKKAIQPSFSVTFPRTTFVKNGFYKKALSRNL